MLYDKTLERGFSIASKENFKFAITLDADGEHDCDDIPKFRNQLENGYDLVIGEREKLPRISEKIVNFYFKKKWNLNDPFCGMKGYNLKWYNEFKRFDRYNSIGTDLALRIIKKKGKFQNIKIKTFQRQDEPRFGNIFSSNFKIIKSSILSSLYNK